MTRHVRRRPHHSLGVAVLALSLVVALTGCGDDGGDDGGEATTSSTTSSSTSSTTTTTPGTTTTATVFFVRDELVAAAGAEVTPPAVAQGAMEALLAGPDDLESELGMTSAVPDGTRLLGLTITDGTATVDLSSEFASGGGSLSMQLRVAQVVYTLTSFDTVERVTIRLDGADVDAIGGEGVPARGLTPDDARDVTPLVLVTSPLPGEQVSSPVRITGISNTFEATVLYRIVGDDGAVLADGFTTATAGTGTWGTFEVAAELDGTAEGPATVSAYQQDMESGGEQDVYDVPVRIG